MHRFKTLHRTLGPALLASLILLATGLGVLLTAITTICGLIPMATGINSDFRRTAIEIGSESSQWWSSLAVAVIFGLAFATVLTLVVVPTFYRAFYGRAEQKRLAALAGGSAHEA